MTYGNPASAANHGPGGNAGAVTAIDALKSLPAEREDAAHCNAELIKGIAVRSIVAEVSLHANARIPRDLYVDPGARLHDEGMVALAANSQPMGRSLPMETSRRPEPGS